MMPEFVVHIGRHKTGTSSLQRFLFDNRDLLETHGLYYPKSGLAAIAHHDIARFLHKKQRMELTEDARRHLARTVRAFRQECEARSGRVLVSSEAFQNCRPGWITNLFPTGQTKVIVYLREQVEYLVSSYQQKVHASGYSGSLAEYYVGRPANYNVFLNRWSRVFGEDALIVRAYNRKRLVNGDIIADFCSVLGLDDVSSFTLSSTDSNPSIGGALLEVKRQLNSKCPSIGADLKVYRLFMAAASAHPEYRAKPRLDTTIVKAIRQSARGSNLKVFQRFFSGQDMFEYADESAPPTPIVLHRAGLREVLDRLNAASPKDFEHLIRALAREGAREGLDELLADRVSDGGSTTPLQSNGY